MPNDHLAVASRLRRLRWLAWLYLSLAATLAQAKPVDPSNGLKECTGTRFGCGPVASKDPKMTCTRCSVSMCDAKDNIVGTKKETSCETTARPAATQGGANPAGSLRSIDSPTSARQ